MRKQNKAVSAIALIAVLLIMIYAAVKTTPESVQQMQGGRCCRR